MHDAHPLPGSDVVVDGVRLNVVLHGAGDGLPILLLHGLPTSSYLWHDVMRDLGRGRRVVAPDLVGLGRSELPRRGVLPDLRTQARLQLQLLDQLGIERALVVGHDLGGAVAVHLAATARDRVAGLVLVDAPIHAEVFPVPSVLPLLAPIAGEAYVASLRRVPRLARTVLARSLGTTLGARELDCYLAPLLRPEGARGLLAFTRAVDLAAAEEAWRVVTADPPPTMVLWGENDRLHSTAYGRRLVAECPGASWVPVADAGHLLPQERPERVAEELAAFAAEPVPA